VAGERDKGPVGAGQARACGENRARPPTSKWDGIMKIPIFRIAHQPTHLQISYNLLFLSHKNRINHYPPNPKEGRLIDQFCINWATSHIQWAVWSGLFGLF
jgi:hypothetical protein